MKKKLNINIQKKIFLKKKKKTWSRGRLFNRNQAMPKKDILSVFDKKPRSVRYSSMSKRSSGRRQF